MRYSGRALCAGCANWKLTELTCELAERDVHEKPTREDMQVQASLPCHLKATALQTQASPGDVPRPTTQPRSRLQELTGMRSAQASARHGCWPLYRHRASGSAQRTRRGCR